MPATRLSAAARAVRRCVSARQDVHAAYVFGSVASGRARPDSDVDVAVLLADRRGRRLDRLSYRLALIADLGSALRRSNVDVVILNDATPLLAHRVLSQGRLVFERSASARVRFQVDVARRYQDVRPLLETHLHYLKTHAREGRLIG